MKFFKKVMTGVLAAALAVSMSTAVFAAGSKTDVSSDTQGVAVQSVNKQNISAVAGNNDAAKTAFSQQFDGGSLSDVLNTAKSGSNEATNKSVEAVLQTTAGKSFVTGFFQLNAEDSVKKADGTVDATITVPELTEDMDAATVQLVVFDPETETWSTVTGTVDLRTKKITANVKPGSIISVVAKAKEAQTPGSGNGSVTQKPDGTVQNNNTTSNKNTTKTSTAKSTSSAAKSSAKSPKTGVSADYMMYLAAALAFAGAAVVVSRKKAA